VNAPASASASAYFFRPNIPLSLGSATTPVRDTAAAKQTAELTGTKRREDQSTGQFDGRAGRHVQRKLRRL
jgi:hypothetical protein